eukprot:1429208-Prorocentrum_lima.AAC.1
MALLCAAILDSSSTTRASDTISDTCLNCTLGNVCTGWCVEVDDMGSSTTHHSRAPHHHPQMFQKLQLLPNMGS